MSFIGVAIAVKVSAVSTLEPLLEFSFIAVLVDPKQKKNNSNNRATLLEHTFIWKAKEKK